MGRSTRQGLHLEGRPPIRLAHGGLVDREATQNENDHTVDRPAMSESNGSPYPHKHLPATTTRTPAKIGLKTLSGILALI